MNIISAKEIVADLHAVGAKLNVVGGKLKIEAAKGVVNSATLDMLRQHKMEIIGLLSGAALAGSAAPAPSLPSWCRVGCPSLDVIPGAGPGCVRSSADGPWIEDWRRLDTLATCPERAHQNILFRP